MATQHSKGASTMPNGLDEAAPLLRAGLDALSFGFALFDKDLKLVASNRAFRELRSYPTALCQPGTGIAEFYRFNGERGDYGPGDIEDHVESRLTRVRQFQPHKLEYALATGRILCIQYTPIAGEGLLLSYADVTERKRAEEELAEKEAQLRIALDNMPGGIRSVDENGNYVFFNARYLELYDFPKELLKVGEPYRIENLYQAKRGDFGPGDPESLTNEWLTSRSRGTEPQSWERTTAAGKVLHVWTAPTPDGGFVNIVTDITERKRAEEALRESETQFRTFIDNTPAQIYMKDREGRHVLVNRQVQESISRLASEIIGKTSADIYPAKLAEKYEEHDKHVLATGEVDAREIDITVADGTARPHLIVKFPVLDADSNIAGVGSYATDITDRKQAEEALRKHEQLLETVLDHMPTPVFLRDLDGRFMLINRGYEDIHEVTKDGVRGKTLYEVFPKDVADDFHTLDPEIIKEGKILEREETHQLPDGKHILAAVKFPIFDASGAVVAVGGVDVDVTDRKRVEEVLREKSESLQLTELITRAANEAVSIEAAMQIALDQVCAHTGWPVGHAYILDEQAGDLAPSGIWHLDDAQAFETFRKVTEATRFESGVGLPGRVFASGQPAWIFDVTKDPNFPRAQLATEICARRGRLSGASRAKGRRGAGVLLHRGRRGL